MAPLLNTRGHKFKLYKKRCSAIIRNKFFSEHVVNTWNNLPSSVDFSSLSSFIRTVKLTDLSDLGIVLGYLLSIIITCRRVANIVIIHSYIFYKPSAVCYVAYLHLNTVNSNHLHSMTSDGSLALAGCEGDASGHSVADIFWCHNITHRATIFALLLESDDQRHDRHQRYDVRRLTLETKRAIHFLLNAILNRQTAPEIYRSRT